MKDHHDTDPLDALLASVPHIDDDGFTQRTMAALPRRRRGRRRGELLYLLFCCMGLFLGLVVFPGAELINLTVQGLLHADPAMPQLTILALVTLATAGWVGWHALSRG